MAYFARTGLELARLRRTMDMRGPGQRRHAMLWSAFAGAFALVAVAAAMLGVLL